MVSLSRRHFLQAIPLGAAGTLISSPMSYVFAEENSITVTSLGGKWEQSIREHFVPHFQKETGANVKIVLGAAPQWMSQIEAQRSPPPLDAIDNTETLAIKLRDMDLAIKLTEESVPNLKDIPSAFRSPWDDYAASYMYSCSGIFYNKEKVSNPPKTWIEFFDRGAKGEFGATIGLPSITYAWAPHFLWHYANIHGGGVDNFDPGFEALRKLKPYITKYFSTAVELERMILAKEIDIGIFWDGRITALMDSAPFLGFSYMEPNMLIGMAPAQVVKGGNEALALKWMNTLLAPEPQLEYFKLINYSPTNSKVMVPDNLRNRLAPIERGVTPDYAALGAATSSLIDRWNREIRQ